MTENIKQFLEADARRTQGEWCVSAYSPYVIDTLVEGSHIAETAGEFDYRSAGDNANFIAAASLIAPDIRQLLAAFEQVCAILEKIARLGNEPHVGNSRGNMLALDALNAAAPYRKGGA